MGDTRLNNPLHSLSGDAMHWQERFTHSHQELRKEPQVPPKTERLQAARAIRGRIPSN